VGARQKGLEMEHVWGVGMPQTPIVASAASQGLSCRGFGCIVIKKDPNRLPEGANGWDLNYWPLKGPDMLDNKQPPSSRQAKKSHKNHRLMLKMERMGKTMVFVGPANTADLNPIAGLNQSNKLYPWPDKYRVMPNEMTRSALFAVVRPGHRKWLENTVIASRSDTPNARIEFTGRQLDQSDCDVWLQALQLAKHKDLGARVYFKRGTFLKALGRQHGGKGYQWMDRSLKRLFVAAVVIKTERYQSAFHLLAGYDLDKKTGEYWLSISPKAKAAFDRYHTSRVDLERRLLIGRGQQLAKWMQNYVCGHEKGGQHTVRSLSLFEWSGVGGRLRDLRTRSLPKALKELERVGIITGGRIRQDDMVTWFRPEA